MMDAIEQQQYPEIVKVKVKVAEERKCKVCEKEAISVKPVEIVPGGGVVMRAVHENNETHSWEQYASLASLTNSPKKDKVLRAKCPRCGKVGRVNSFRSYTSESKVNGIKYGVRYVIVHETVPGTWGKVTVAQKRRRCFIDRKEYREQLLKEIGRFIP